MQLKPHQEKTVKEAKDKWGLWFKMRVGKTPTAIKLASNRTKSCLVICPKSLKNQWEREIKIWNENSKCVFAVRSKEDIRLNKNIPKCEAVIIDEVHNAFGNYKSKTFKSLQSYLIENNIQYIWLLTGTPFTASAWSVYSYGILLGKKWPWYKWKQAFFFDVLMGRRRVPMPKAGMEGKLQEILRSIGTVIDLKDVMELAEDYDVIETFSLNKEQKKLIEEHFDPLPITRYTRQHELEQGVLKTDGYRESIICECDKDKRLLEIVNETDKIVIVARYHDQIAKYVHLFQDLRHNIYQIHGKIKEQAADIALKAQNDPCAIVIVQGDTCAGYSLKNFNLMVFASMSYSFVAYDQVRSRLKDMSKHESCTYIHLLTEGKSIDKAVYDSVIKKQNFSIELYDQTRS